jgi:hypothetical protein
LFPDYFWGFESSLIGISLTRQSLAIVLTG